MNPMQNKTPEERRAIAAKGRATRKARLDAAAAERRAAETRAGWLSEQIATLEARLARLQRMEAANEVAAELTGKTLLTAEEISAAAVAWPPRGGVYFLLDGSEVVYVGQAVNVHARLLSHQDKSFDRYAFVPCPREAFDKLESLYIHCLRPRLNGDRRDGAKFAPLSLADLSIR